jgi:phospholipase C
MLRSKSRLMQRFRLGVSALALGQMIAAPAFAAGTTPAAGANDNKTVSPIKHVIIIIGENRSFDHVFATFPAPKGQTINNLLSSGIIKLDANKNAIPGPNFAKAHQVAATDAAPDTFLLSPPKQNFPNDVLPTPLVGGAEFSHFQKTGTGTTGTEDTGCKSFASLLACVEGTENGLPASYYPLLLTGGYGNALFVAEPRNPAFTNDLVPPASFTVAPDLRISNVTNLPAGPFQLTNGTNGTSFPAGTTGLAPALTYDSYTASPVHRFYQMYQQLNCKTNFLSELDFANPSGCNGQLFAWVETTIGTGSNGLPPPSNFTTNFPLTPALTSKGALELLPSPLPPGTPVSTTGEGSIALGFYNVQQGDVPYFTSLAQQYGMSDNFHQSVMGGTGVNHIMFGHGDMLWFSDGNGHPQVPPNGVKVFTTFNGAPNPDAGVVNEIENPNPLPGTNNWYTEDGYGQSFNAGFPASDFGLSASNPNAPVYGGGSYTNCSDPTQPGVKPITDYLASLPFPVRPNCEPGHYYLLNNYNPGYFGNGNNAFIDQNPSNTPFTIPPSSVPSIGDNMNAHNISWKYYGDQWNNYLPDPYQLNFGTPGPTADEYCNICNPFQYDTSIMSNPAQVAAHLQDTLNLYSDISNNTLPAVSIVKPSGYVDGHPSSSKLNLFEGFTQKIVQQVQSSAYAQDTVIFITFDEGGGYYDSGYVQPLDFFGDGTRIPLIVVSPFAKKGYISHQYTDHVSLLKFIEHNWLLPPVSNRSRDNFPNPIAVLNPYVPDNSPAIGDLFDFFNFGPVVPVFPGFPVFPFGPL